MLTAERLLESWFEATLASAVLALMLWCVGRRVMSARWLHLGWSVVLLKLLVPPLVLIPVLPDISSLSLNAEMEMTGELEKGQSPFNVSAGATDVQSMLGYVGDPPDQKGHELPDVDAAHLVSRDVTETLNLHRLISQLPSVMLGIWAMGLVYALVVALRRLWGLRVVEHELQPAEECDERILNELCGRLRMKPGRRPELKVVGLAVSPMVKSWGFVGRPVLIVPELLWKSWREAEKRAVLAHELAHVKRGDDRFAWLGLAVRLLQWHNPLAYWAFRQWKEAEEDAADALALATLGGGAQARRDLAGAILQTIEFLKNSRRPWPRFQPVLQMISTLTTARALKRRVAAIGRFSVAGYQSRNCGGWIIGGMALLALPLGIVTAQPAAQAVETLSQGNSEMEIAAQNALVEPQTLAIATEAIEVQIELSLDERLLVMEEKLRLIEAEVRELRQARVRKLAVRKARQPARNSNAISE